MLTSVSVTSAVHFCPLRLISQRQTERRERLKLGGAGRGGAGCRGPAREVARSMRQGAGRVWLALLVVGVAVSLVKAEEPGTGAASPTLVSHPHVWQPRTTSVAVFKNGLGFVTRRGAVQLRDGWCYAAEVPPAAFGTLAVYAHDPDRLVDLVGSGNGEVVTFDDHDAPRDAGSKQRRLEALLGLRVELQYEQPSGLRTATGKLASVSPQYVVLEAPEQTMAVPLEKLMRLQVLELPLRVHVQQSDETPAPEADLGIAYLRQGFLWVPEYTLKILDEQTAELTLRGTLINEAEDLVHCDVNFVVGVPHFVHSDLMSPIAVGRALRTIGSSLPSAQVPPQVMSQMMNRAAIANNSFTADPFAAGNGGLGAALGAPDDERLGELVGNLPQLDSAGPSDFTVYTKRDLTVRRGERAIVTLFTHRIRYHHRYRLELPGAVQHFLALENTTPTAWTTGPCLTLAAGNPLSEDVLKYTPRGVAGEVQITTAINVAHTQAEEEAERQLKAHEPRDNEFLDRVTIAGSIRIKSFEKQAVELVVELPLPGRPLEADQEGEIRVDASRLRLVERAGSVRWQRTLRPEEELLLKYRYERFVPSN
jgi:hypothetical protein